MKNIVHLNVVVWNDKVLTTKFKILTSFLKDQREEHDNIFHFLQECVLKLINLTYPQVLFSCITHNMGTSSFFPCVILAFTYQMALKSENFKFGACHVFFP